MKQALLVKLLIDLSIIVLRLNPALLTHGDECGILVQPNTSSGLFAGLYPAERSSKLPQLWKPPNIPH